MARIRNRRKPVAEMNVVPYIDVMLVLLVIFMVTAPMLNQGVKVDLPKVSSEVLPQDNNSQVLTISIKADKSYYWNMGTEVDVDTVQDKALTLEEMTRAVTAIINQSRATGKQVQVFVRGDKSVDYGTVMAAMGGLQQADVGNVGLITEAPLMHYQRERSPSESLFWPLIWAVGLHVIMFAMLFVSFAFAPDLPPAKPVVQATLYKLQSQSQATTQTNQKIAGETKKTTAPVYETEQLEQKKAEQEKVAAKAVEQKKAQEAQKAEAAAEAAKKAEANKTAEEQKKLADVAKKQAADEAAKKKAAEDAKKKAVEDAKKKAAQEAKKKAAADAAKKKTADDAKKKSAEAAQRKAVEDKKAAALAELLSDDVGRQQAVADTVGDEVAGSLDDLIVMLVSQQWRRPPSARNGMSVEVLIEMLPDGTITNASVTRSSGDSPFDNSAVQAVRNVGRIAEMQQLDRVTFDRLYRQRRAVFKPEDLGL